MQIDKYQHQFIHFFCLVTFTCDVAYSTDVNLWRHDLNSIMLSSEISVFIAK